MSDDPLVQNVQGVTQLVESDINKLPQGVMENEEGVHGEKKHVLELDLSDDELLRLRDDWEAAYAPYEALINARQKDNKKYYKGAQLESSGYVNDEVIASNLQFQAAETFYAAALAKNPDPVVYSDNSEEGNKIANDVKTMLQYHADYLDLRAKLMLQTRQWSIYLLGVKKWGWDNEINEVCCEVRKIQDFIFDPDGYVDSKAHFNGYLGERITVTAEKLIELFPDAKDYILIETEGKLGTKVTYTEWWTDEFCFTTYKKKVLDKHKNEYFKYPQDNKLGVEVQGINHFPKPKKPYTFLSVFSLGEQPHDITSLIEQNIPNQNKISRRDDQIDKNLNKSLNSDLFSEDNFTQETAKQAANALDGKGSGKVLVPQGRPINEAIVRLPAPGIADAYFKDLESTKETLLSSWGVTGLTAQEPKEDVTARGMILNQQYDNTRIGGGIGEAIERVAKADFNWLVQLYYVFYDEPHFASIMGQLQAVEYVELSAKSMGNRRLIVSVAADSMKPHDDLTEINQAIQFFELGAIGPKTLLTIANFPDPDESAMDGVLWKTDPMMYLQLNWPEMAQILQQKAMEQAQMQALSGGQPQQPGQTATNPGEAQNQPPAEPSTAAVPPAGAALDQVPIPK